MSIKGVASSVGKAFNTGLNLGVGRGITGAGGLGAVATMGMIGAGIGATSTLASNGTVDPGTGALVGGAVGTAALPATGLAVGALGAGVVGAASAAPTVASGALAATPYIAGAGVTMAAHAGSAVWGVGRRMINWNEDAVGFDKVKFTGPAKGFKAGWKDGINSTKTGAVGHLGNFVGKKSKRVGDVLGKLDKGVQATGGAVSGTLVNGMTVMGAAAIVDGTKKAWNTMQTTRMGQMTGVKKMAPTVPSYADNSGATGDLVFALNANRRG